MRGVFEKTIRSKSAGPADLKTKRHNMFGMEYISNC